MSFEEEGYLRWGLSEKKNVLDLFRRYQDACDELITLRRRVQELETNEKGINQNDDQRTL